MISVVGPPSPLDLSVEEFLARLKRDRRGTLEVLQQRPWRVTALHVDANDFWELFDETVRDDGTVDLAALAARGDPVVSSRAALRGAASAVVELCLAAYVASDEARVTVESARGVVTISVAPNP